LRTPAEFCRQSLSDVNAYAANPFIDSPHLYQTTSIQTIKEKILMNNLDNNDFKGQHVISDINGALNILIGAVACGAIGLYIFFTTFFSFIGLIFSSLFILIGYGLYKNFQITNRGYVVDVDNDLLLCPGNKEPTNLTEMFSISNFKKSFSGITIKLSDIQSVQSASEKSYNEVTKSWGYLYKLTIVGGFGVYAAGFKDQEKRDQLSTLLIQVCRMGEPTVVR